MSGRFQVAVLSTVTALLPLVAQAETPPPACRFDVQAAKLVESTLQLAVRAYGQLGRPLPFERVSLNPSTPINGGKTLNVYVVIDASDSAVDRGGCPTASKTLIPNEVMDRISVRGGCVASAEGLEVRCSSSAIQVFGQMGREGRANPALLYVLAHELAHILQGRAGEYAGRVDKIDLSAPANLKLQSHSHLGSSNISFFSLAFSCQTFALSQLSSIV